VGVNVSEGEGGGQEAGVTLGGGGGYRCSIQESERSFHL
jgi:hypothetical protein